MTEHPRRRSNGRIRAVRREAISDSRKPNVFYAAKALTFFGQGATLTIGDLSERLNGNKQAAKSLIQYLRHKGLIYVVGTTKVDGREMNIYQRTPEGEDYLSVRALESKVANSDYS